MGAGVPFPGAQPPFAPGGPAVAPTPTPAPMPMHKKHKHHPKKKEGRGTNNEEGRRRNPRGGSM